MVARANKNAVTGFNVIIGAIVAIAVLVVLLLLLSTGLGGSIKTIFGIKDTALSGTEISSAKVACSRYCNEAKAFPPNLDDWSRSLYCTKKFAIDLDGDGEINPNTELFHCYREPISVKCSLRTKDNVDATEAQCT